MYFGCSCSVAFVAKGLWSGHHVVPPLVPLPDNCVSDPSGCAGQPPAAPLPTSQDQTQGKDHRGQGGTVSCRREPARPIRCLPFGNQMLPPPPGVPGSETRLLASSAGQLLHPHRLGAHEQSQQRPQSPADLPLYQVRDRQRWEVPMYKYLKILLKALGIKEYRYLYFT